MFECKLGIRIVDYLNKDDDFIIPDIVATTEKRVTIKFDYPLSNPATFVFKSELGFTLAAIVDRVCETYREIYDEENRTSKIDEGCLGTLLNRNSTNGKYGIWGHDLSDLFLEYIEECEDGIWRLGIGS